MIQSVVDVVVASEPFERVFRTALLNGHRLMFDRAGGNVAFDVADAGTVVTGALRSVAPDVARQIPHSTDATLLDLRRRRFAEGTLDFADDVRVLGLLLPALSLGLFVVAVAIAPDRRRAITRSGVAIGVTAAALIVVLIVFRAYLISHVFGEDELTNADVRDAVGVLWDAFLGDLSAWALGIGAFALILAAASASLLRPVATESGLERLRGLVRPAASRRRRAAQGIGALLLGVFAVLQPSLAVQTVAVVAGAVLVYTGAGVLMSLVDVPEQRAERGSSRGSRRFALAAAAAVVALAVVGLGVALVLNSGDDTSRGAAAANRSACNGYEALCDRRLDEVAFAGAHNAMSAADTEGWFLVNQRRGIDRQLRDGIRLFLIDPHYGVRTPDGKVRTDFRAERRDLNRVAKALDPQTLRTAERLGGRVGLGDLKGGKRDVWLCHSVCELGATRMVDALTTMRRFLDRNPREVVILFDEDYVSEADLDRAYRESGLRPYLAELDRTKPLPTLRQLIDANRRVIVFTERKPSGEYAWNHDGFAWVQDTPLGATKPKDFSCAPNRGEPDSPLLAINHWIDRFPPPLRANRPVLERRFIERRLRRCHRQRGMLPNLIASDFYDQGDLVEAVAELNGVAGARPPPVR